MSAYYVFEDLNAMGRHWVVGSGEADDYAKAGAQFVIEGGGLCASRNVALEAAFSAAKVCVQISDDVHSLSFVDSSRDADWKPPKSISHANDVAKAANIYLVSFVAAARYIESCARHLGAKLGGVYPCPNEGQACGGPPLATQHFVVGDFIVVTESKPRFDTAMTLKEDYDMTAQHLFLYGIIARSNRIVIRADHYSNAGGAVACRNKTREAQNIKHLRQKWPGAFLNSPRGPQEVRLRWDKRDVAIGGTRIYEPDPKNPGRAIYDQEEAKRVRERRLEKEAAGNKRPKIKS